MQGGGVLVVLLPEEVHARTVRSRQGTEARMYVDVLEPMAVEITACVVVDSSDEGRQASAGVKNNTGKAGTPVVGAMGDGMHMGDKGRGAGEDDGGARSGVVLSSEGHEGVDTLLSDISLDGKIKGFARRMQRCEYVRDLAKRGTQKQNIPR